MANQLKFFLFNCDNTYNLEVVEKFLLDLEEKYDFKFSIDCLIFGLPLMAEVCEKTLPKLAMDVAVFVVHANESRLSINEDNAGIGYASLYRALLQKTALNMGGSGAPRVYLAGTVLLETYVRYGSISFNPENIFQEEGGWRPTAKQMSDLMSGFKSIPLAKVTFVSLMNGGVSYSVVKVKTYDWWERGLSSSGRFRPCFSWLKGNYKVCTVACVLGLVVLLWYLWSSEN